MKLTKSLIVALILFGAVDANAQQKTTKATTAPVAKKEATIEEFKKRNQQVKSVSWERGKVMVVEKTDGTIEKYKLDNYTEEEKAKSIYGKLPASPREYPDPNRH